VRTSGVAKGGRSAPGGTFMGGGTIFLNLLKLSNDLRNSQILTASYRLNLSQPDSDWLIFPCLSRSSTD